MFIFYRFTHIFYGNPCKCILFHWLMNDPLQVSPMKLNTELVFVIDSLFQCYTRLPNSYVPSLALFFCNFTTEKEKNYFTFSFNHIFPFCWELAMKLCVSFSHIFTSFGSKQMWHEVAFHVFILRIRDWLTSL